MVRKGSVMPRLGLSASNRKLGQNVIEDLWRQLFSDPLQWWDHTTHKVDPNYPDFKHKKTGVALWIKSRLTPSWVKTDLPSLTPGSLSRSLYSWNAIISNCVKFNQGLDALKLYHQMQEEGVIPDAFTFARVTNACASLMALEQGRCVHAHVIARGCQSDVVVGNTLIDMYAKCGSIKDAQKVFYKMPYRDVVSWNAMLTGYLKCEQGQKVLEQFALMQEEGIKPNAVTFVVVLSACASILALEEGRGVHAHAIRSGYELDVFVGSTLVDMYAKCGTIEDAHKVFCKMPTRNVVSWNAMLTGCVNCEQGQKALEQFALMQEEAVLPDPVTFVVVLSACASLMALEEGRRVHAQAIESGCESDVFVGTTLVDMYAKCGSIEDAQKVFKKMPTRNVVSWNAMLGAFAMHGQARDALHLFQDMHEAGVEMHAVTFISLLAACSHSGLVDEGVKLFESMGSVYGVSQTREHYICMIDLLGRAGRLHEAELFLRNEPVVSEDSAALRALLGACRNHGNVEMANRIAQQIFESNAGNAPGYGLL